MGYHVVNPETLSPTPEHPCDRRDVTGAADLATLAAARYRLEPGEQLPRTYHYHRQREELFYVLAGSLHVETPEEEFAVESDEVFVAEPESPHRAFNPDDADEEVVAFGVGAPRTDPGLPYEG